MDEEIIEPAAVDQPTKRAVTVYSVEFKMAKVREFAAGGWQTRAEYSRHIGVPSGTFDGWYWKYAGIERGHAKEARQALPAAGPIDVTDAVRTAGPSRQPTAKVWVNGVEIEAGAEGMAMLVAAIRGLC